MVRCCEESQVVYKILKVLWEECTEKPIFGGKKDWVLYYQRKTKRFHKSIKKIKQIWRKDTK